MARPIANEKVLKYTYRTGEVMQIARVNDTDYEVQLRMADDGAVVQVTHTTLNPMLVPDFAVGDSVSVQYVYSDWVYATPGSTPYNGEELLVVYQHLERLSN